MQRIRQVALSAGLILIIGTAWGVVFAQDDAPSDLIDDPPPAPSNDEYGDAAYDGDAYGSGGYDSTYWTQFDEGHPPPDPDAPIDEGIRYGKKVSDFPPERRDVFREVDRVADASGALRPLELDQNEIYGRNTWLLWSAGNERFWDWFAQNGYGFLDFLKMLDSRQRHRRFRDLGLINQPGMKSSQEPGPWGLFIDTVETALPGTDGTEPNYRGPSYNYVVGENQLKSDGVDPHVYGYPSGVIGLRLFPNPNFDEAAQARWNANAFYQDPDYGNDPSLVRPFRIGMSCGFCHIAPHPLDPPVNAEDPEWKNLSSIIGNQYFKTSAVLGGTVRRSNFIWHFLAAQQPGTIDTSMVSTDHINNANTVNAVFEVPARIKRSFENPAEIQGPVAQTFPQPFGEGKNPRYTPRVLVDGSDSTGAWAALGRVYVNIGTYSEEWNECHNPFLGFTEQRPFSVERSRSNSLYWQVNEAFRVKYLADFFTDGSAQDPQAEQPAGPYATQSMRLEHAIVQEGDREVPFLESGLAHHLDPVAAGAGFEVFVRSCMICHSSKQPDGFAVKFLHDPPGEADAWADVTRLGGGAIVMPYDGAHWEDFKRSPSYRRYLEEARSEWEKPEFLEHNYLSTDIRIPVSLVQTNASRALGTNAMTGEVWDEYASETYKALPPVGRIAYYDPYTRETKHFQPDGNGPGYYRPATLASVWATAPLLHNNALGHYIPDHEANHRVSVAGRLEMFDDAVEKLLWRDRRDKTPSGVEGRRTSDGASWHGPDSGWIFRTDQRTEIVIPRLHLRRAAESIVPSVLLLPVDFPWVVPLLLVIATAWAFKYRLRVLLYLAPACGIVVLLVLWTSGLRHILPGWWSWLGWLLLFSGPLLLFTKSEGSSYWRHVLWQFTNKAAPVMLFALATVLWGTALDGKRLIDGERGDLRFGPIPKGTPVSAVWSLDPEAPLLDQLSAGRGLLFAVGTIRDKGLEGDAALAVFEDHAGPALLKVSKSPDYVMDRGHYFGESLTDEEKRQLIAFLKNL